MNKRIVLLVAIILSHAVVLIIGAYIGVKRTKNEFIAHFISNKYEVMLGQYIAYRNIAMHIRDKKIELAKCNSDLMASTLLDSLRSCMNDSSCSKFIESGIHDSAPEVIDQSRLPFDYISSKNGKKECDGNDKK